MSVLIGKYCMKYLENKSSVVDTNPLIPDGSYQGERLRYKDADGMMYNFIWDGYMWVKYGENGETVEDEPENNDITEVIKYARENESVLRQKREELTFTLLSKVIEQNGVCRSSLKKAIGMVDLALNVFHPNDYQLDDKYKKSLKKLLG